MTNDPVRRGLFGRLSTPDPPAELKAKTLAAAMRAAGQPRPHSAWQAVRAFFAAQPRWTTALAVVIAAHVLFGLLPVRSPSVEADLPRRLEVDAQPDLLRLPRIEDVRLGPLAAPIEEAPGAGDPS